MSIQLTGHKLMHHVDELYKWKNGIDFYPIHVDISPTSLCNHKCFHCYVSYLERSGDFLKEKVFCDLMRDLGRTGVKSAFIAGTGEPFLNKATGEAIRIGAEGGVDLGVATNGIVLNPKKLEEVLPHLTWIRFSILGGSAATYAKYHGTQEKDWHILEENLAAAAQIKKEKNLPVTIGAVYCMLPENGKEVTGLAEMLKRIGFDYLVVRPITQNPKNNLNVDLYLHERFEKELKYIETLSGDGFQAVIRFDQFNCLLKRDYGKCHGLPFISVVSANGGVYSCNGYWNNPDFCYGNLNEASFKAIWDSDRRKAIQKRVETAVDFNQCEPICRQNSINKFLWDLKQTPEHVNFI